MEGDGEEGEEGVEDVKRGVGVKGEGKGGCGGRGGRAKKRVWKEVYVENCSMFHLLTVFDMLFTRRELVSGAQTHCFNLLHAMYSKFSGVLLRHLTQLDTYILSADHGPGDVYP